MDFELNHSGEILEDALGNDREMTIALRDSLKADSRSRFRITAILGGLFGFLGVMFILFMRFIPVVVDLWFMGMAVGMFIAGLLGMFLSMPVTDSVAVHLKVIDYVDNVIKNTDYRRPDLMAEHKGPDGYDDDDVIELSSEEDEDETEEEETGAEEYRTD